MKAENSLGSFSLRRQRRPSGGFYPTWRVQVLFKGKSTMLTTPFAICEKCLRAFENDGQGAEDKALREAMLSLCKAQVCRKAAVAFGEGVLSRMTSEWVQEMTTPAPVAGARVMNEATSRATVGDVVTRLLDPAEVTRKETKQVEQCARSLRRVVAWAFDLWRVHQGGIQGVAIGARVPDERRCDAMLLGEVLTEAAVVRYFEAQVGGKINWREPMPGNVTINSTLKQARDCFRGRVKRLLRDVALPGSLAEWMECSLLPQARALPEPIEGGLFDAMVSAAEARGPGDDLYWINLALRQTGLRCGSLARLRYDAADKSRSWLKQMSDGWWLLVREGKSEHADLAAIYELPIGEELAGRLMTTRYGCLIEGDLNERLGKVNALHNQWLKRGDGNGWGGIGEPKRGKQGNHRFRDTMATAVLTLHGARAAAACLGHADEKTTREHYGRERTEPTAVMRREFAALGRVK